MTATAFSDPQTITVVTFAPVQGFISSSRKLRDLYGSSLLLSHLAKAIVDDANQRQFVVLSPALVNTVRGTPNLLVIAGDYRRGYGLDALRSAWSQLLAATRSWIEQQLPRFEYDWDASWKLWQNHAWEYFHGQGGSIGQARRNLAINKQQRAWSAINWTGESSTLAGSDAIARPAMAAVIDPRQLTAAAADQQATAFIKALQALPALGAVFAGVGEQLSLPELVKRLVTYPPVARQSFRDERLLDVIPSRFDGIAESSAVAWFMADGDQVGSHLERQAQQAPSREAEQLSRFSGAMRSWAERLYAEVPRLMDGKATVVYAGGDDLLGALHDQATDRDPHRSAPLVAADLLRWLQRFPQLWSEHGQLITVSMGIVLVRGQVPQREALQQVRLAEASAKAHGRDRFALRLLFSGGQAIEWVCPWAWLPRILAGYRDRDQRSGERAHWGHLAADVAALRSRHALAGSTPEARAVAAALWSIYFPDLESPPQQRQGSSAGIDQPLGEWLSDLAQVLARLHKPVHREAIPA